MAFNGICSSEHFMSLLPSPILVFHELLLSDAVSHSEVSPPVRSRFSAKQSLVDSRKRRNRLLTSREREVLYWLARGKTNAEIGAILGISAATVGKHLEHIYPKLGVENRTAAASFATGVNGK